MPRVKTTPTKKPQFGDIRTSGKLLTMSKSDLMYPVHPEFPSNKNVTRTAVTRIN